MTRSDGQAGLQSTDFTVSGRELRLFGFPGDHIFERIKQRGEPYEHDLLAFVHELLAGRPDGVVVDVGANLGNHSVYFAAVMGRQVVAVEPEADNLRALRENLASNDIEGMVDVHALAAWNEAGQIGLVQQMDGNRGTFSARAEDAGPIEGRPLDDILGDAPVALIKIDVEGAERRVVEGALRVLERWLPILVIESHGAAAVAELTTLLEPLGYRRTAVLGLSDNYIWAAPPAAAEEIRQLFNLETARKFQRLVLHNSDVQGKRLLALREQLSTVAEAVGARDAEAGGASDTEAGALQHLLEGLAQSVASLEASVASFEGATSGAASAEERARALSDAAGQRFERAAVEVSAAVDEKLSRFDRRLQELTALVAEGHGLGRAVQRELTDQLVVVAEDIRGSLDSTLQRHIDTIDDSRDELESVRDQRDRIARAYAQLSRRYERAHPSEWSSSGAVRGALGGQLAEVVGELIEEAELDQDQSGDRAGGSRDGAREITPLQRGRDRVRIGIASMPGREAALLQVLRILSPQADEIFVYLNGMDEVPSGFDGIRNVRFFTGEDLGDRAKFLFLEGFDGYYLTCDDDIEYARFHVASIIDGIERYARRAVVGWHGSLFSDDFEQFYEAKSRKVLSFRFLRGKDTGVHLLGTGVCGFHTDTVRPTMDEFVHPNMADAFLAIHAQRREVPMVVLAHKGGEAMPIDTPGSISAASLGKDARGKAAFDVAGTVTRLVKEQMPWRTFEAEPVFVRERVRVAIVGRTDRERWKKGGILKSCHLTREMLTGHGWDVYMADIETGDPLGLEGFIPDLVMVYVGDPERPDFAKVIEIVETHASRGARVLVNLSDNGRQTRHEAIVQRMRIWGERFRGRVRLMAFAAEAAREPSLVELQELVVPIPKTLVFEDTAEANWAGSNAIFVGDVAKLSDDSLIGGAGREWIDGIRRAVPEARIVGVRQYTPRYDVDLGLDEVWPFMKGREFVERLRSVRIAVSAVKFATFEMVPVEVAALGIPTFYRAMPHSLSAYLGQAGIEVDSVKDLELRLPAVYRDPLVWRGYSEAGILRAKSVEFQHAAASMILELSAFIKGTEDK